MSRYELGPFRVDIAERLLTRDGQPVPLTAKAFDVLQLLIANAGRTVTKEEFMTAVWPDAVVEEANLTDNISTLRQALGDDAREPRYIQTVPRRGYRFVAEVREAPDDRTVAATAPPPPRPRRRWLVPAIALVVAVVAIGATLLLLRRPEPAKALPFRAVAVFPFDPLGSDAAGTHLGVSIADSLISRLTTIDDLVVRPVSAVLGYATSGRDAMAAAREQNVDAFVEGRVLKRGSRVRVTVQIVSVREARTLWARTFDEDASNLFAVEDGIAEAVANELSVRAVARGGHVPDPAAYELYGAGRYFWSRSTPESLETSARLFRQAIAIDPRFAAAHAGLADAYSAMGIWNFKPPRDAFPLAKEAALAALALDPELAEARTSLAYVKFRFDWDVAGAEQEFRRAIAARRNYATARVMYAEYLMAMQRYDEAAAELQKARELDPRSPYLAMISAVRHYFMRDYTRAAAGVRALLAEQPDYFIAREFLWAVLRESGDHDGSVAVRLETLRPVAIDAESVEQLRAVYRTAGLREYRHAENRFLLSVADRQYVPAVFLAMNHAENGEVDQAMQWLEKACGERSGWMVELRVDPAWDAIRHDPRFIALATRVLGGAW